MPKYFILAFKPVELRGFIHAKTMAEARQKALDSWQIYDTSDNTITAGSIDPAVSVPIISESDKNINIIHIEDENGYKHRRGIEVPKWKIDGKRYDF